MGKSSLRMEQKEMSSALTVSEARGWADYLTQRNFRGPGDTVEAAMNRAARKSGVPFKTFWSLRYNRARRLWADTYLALRNAYENEVLRQEAKLRDELNQFEKVMGPAAASDPYFRAAKAALEAIEKEREG